MFSRMQRKFADRRLILRAQVSTGGSQNHRLSGLTQVYLHAVGLSDDLPEFGGMADRAESALRAVAGGMAVEDAMRAFRIG